MKKSSTPIVVASVSLALVNTFILLVSWHRGLEACTNNINTGVTASQNIALLTLEGGSTNSIHIDRALVGRRGGSLRRPNARDEPYEGDDDDDSVIHGRPKAIDAIDEHAALANTTTTTPSTTTAATTTTPSVYDGIGYTPSPARAKYNFTVAICAMVKDHEAYITEWLDYNLKALEFDAIYLYDNSDKFDMETWYRNTRDHPVYSKVHVEHRPGKEFEDEYVQLWVYNNCVRRHGKKGERHEYIAMIDSDEFIVFQNHSVSTRKNATRAALANGVTTASIDLDELHDDGEKDAKELTSYTFIHEFVNDYLAPYDGGVTMNWMYFGTANKTIYAPVPLTKRYQYRDPEPHELVKSIISSRAYKYARNPHAAVFYEGYSAHDTTYPGSHPGDGEPRRKTNATNPKKPDKIVLVYHYRFKSPKEYTFKMCHRGEATGLWRVCDRKKNEVVRWEDDDHVPDHMYPRPGVVFDDKAWQFLTRYVPKYRVYDTPEWEEYL